MAHELLIDLEKLQNNFDEIYEQAEQDVIIKVVKGSKVLRLVKNKEKRTRGRPAKQN